jgi:hypothetical protein
MPLVSADNPSSSKNLNPHSQSSGQSSAGRQNSFSEVTVPDTAGGAAKFSVAKEKETAGSPHLRAQREQLEAKLKNNPNVLTELVSQRPELTG